MSRMSNTPPEGGGESAPIPPGYQPGDYIPHADRSPEHPWAIAGQPDLQPAATHPAHAGVVKQYREMYGYDAPARVPYAGWWARVVALLIDSLFGAVTSAPAIVGYYMLLDGTQTVVDEFGVQTLEFVEVDPAAVALIAIGAVTGFAFYVWNICLRQGRTGYSLGKSAMGIQLLSESSGAPIGAGRSFVRDLAHTLDSFCYIGYLWPIWDRKKQTFADKVMRTIVIVQPPPPKA